MNASTGSRRGGVAAVIAAGCALALLVPASPAVANPSGGLVVGGAATITNTPGSTVIDQTSNKAIVNWRSFSIGGNEVTRFNQPGANAIALNRVISKDPSNIQGQLQANGNVWIVNRNGILFGPSAQVDVHGLVASTADIKDADFLNDRFDFSLPSPDAKAAVVNQGRISFGEKGLAALVAPHARNDGVIVGQIGQVVIAGAPTFSLDLQGDGLIRFGTSSKVLQAIETGHALAENKGTISVDGGYVLLTADAAESVVDHLVNADGIIEARSLAAADGKIELRGGDSGAVTVAGNLDATGGTVSIQGRTISTQGSGSVTASSLTLASTATSPQAAGTATLQGSVDRLGAGVSATGGAPFASVAMNNGKDLTVDGIRAGSVFVTANGTLTLNQPIVTTASGNGIVLVADSFINTAGPAALDPGPGRFLVYTDGPDGDVTGGLAGGQKFDATFASAPPQSISQPGNLFVYAAPPPPPPPPAPPPPEIVLTPEQLVQATLVTPAYEVAQAGSVAALTTALPPKTSLFAPPREQRSGEGDVMFSNDGNHALWGLSTPSTALP